MPARRNPGQLLARRRLGNGLRALRETANLRIEAAASELECSPAKISRLEHGLGPAKLWDVRILLNLYGVQDPDERARYEQWAHDTKTPGWWESDSDLTDDVDRYLAAETAATRLSLYCTPVLTSQLQTADYAAAHVRALYPSWPPEDVDRFVRLRLARQEAVFRDDDPLGVVAVLDEGAVRRRVGSRDVHRAQLSWLADRLEDFAAGGRDSLVVRVLPLTAGIPSRALNPFVIFEPAQPDLDPVSAAIEDTLGETWLESDDVGPLIDIFGELLEMSLSAEQSREFLREVARQP